MDVADLEQRARHLEAIKEQQKLVRACTIEVDEARGELRERKGELEHALARLQQIIEAQDKPLPLFDPPPAPADDAERPTDPDTPDVGSFEPPAPDEEEDAELGSFAAASEGADQQPISTLGLPMRIEKALRAVDVTTVGELQDAVAEGTLSDLPGIGKAAEEVIRTALAGGAEGAAGNTEPESHGPLPESPPEDAEGAAAWDTARKRRIWVLDLPDKIVDKLDEAGIRHIGELQDRVVDNMIGTVRGIGEAAEEAIRKALADWDWR